MDVVEVSTVVQLVQILLAILLALVFTLTLAWGISNHAKAKEWKHLAQMFHEGYTKATEASLQRIADSQQKQQRQLNEIAFMSEIDRQIEEAINIANETQEGECK